MKAWLYYAHILEGPGHGADEIGTGMRYCGLRICDVAYVAGVQVQNIGSLASWTYGHSLCRRGSWLVQGF